MEDGSQASRLKNQVKEVEMLPRWAKAGGRAGLPGWEEARRQK